MAYKFATGSYQVSGALKAATTISGAGGLAAQSLIIGNSQVISATKAIGNVTTISGAAAIAGASLKINAVTVATQAGALIAPTTVSGAGEIAGQSLKIGNSVVITAAKVLQNVTFSPSSLSGNVELNIFPEALFTAPGSSIKASGSITGSNIVATSDVSGAGEIVGQNFKAATTISGAGGLAAQNLVIGNSSVISPTKAIGNATTISGAAEIAGASLKINAVTVATQAGALVAPTTVSGAGGLAGQNLVIGNSNVISATKAIGNATTISGAAEIAGASLKINNTTVATQAGALIAPTTVSGAGAVSGQNLVLENFKISSVGLPSGSLIGDLIVHGLKASGSVTLGSNKQDDITVNGPLTLNNTIVYSRLIPTGTINAAQVGEVGEADTFIHCSGGGIITLELPEEPDSGSVFYIKRASSGAFGPMTHNVKIETTFAGDTIEGGNAHITLETAGASVMLIASGCQGNSNKSCDWQVF